MESIKQNLFSSNTCHKIIPSAVPVATKDQSLQSRITHLQDIDGKSQSSFDKAFIIEVPCRDEAQKIMTFWNHQTHVANIFTSAFFGACMTSLLLVSKSIVMPYSLISTITLVAGLILAKNKKKQAQEQVQLYSDPTFAYAQKLDQTRKMFLDKTFTELCQTATTQVNKELILQILHPNEIRALFSKDLEKINAKEHLLHPFENSKNGENKIAFFKIFFESPLFSEHSLQIALVPIEKASYITKTFSKLTQEYKSGNFSKKLENATELESRLKQISYLKSEVEFLLEYVNDKELFTSTLGKSYSYNNKSAERLYMERTWKHAKATAQDSLKMLSKIYQETVLNSQSTLNCLNKHSKIFAAKALDFYSKEKKRLQPHIEELQNQATEAKSLARNIIQMKLKPELQKLAERLNRDTLFS